MKSRLILILLLAILFKNTFSQCPSVTVANISNFIPLSIDSLKESDGLRNGPSYNGATLFYPLNSLDNYKSIVLVPGYYATQKSVVLWAKYFASRGFICMTIGTNSLNELPNQRATALLDAMETIRQENRRIASPLRNKLDTFNIAVGGWSMGGGGAQFAAAMDSRVKAVFAIAPWLDYNTLIPDNLNHSSPVLIFSGQLDNVAPPAQNANVHYSYTPASTKKILFEISGGDHNTALYPGTGSGDLGNIAFAWLNLFLKDDSCFCEIVKNDSLNQHSTASIFMTNINCGSTTNIPGNSSVEFPEKFTLNQNYPNPFNPGTTISFAIPQPGYTSLKIYNTLGVEITTLVSQLLQAGKYSIHWDGTGLPGGIYFYRLESGKITETKKLILLP